MWEFKTFPTKLEYIDSDSRVESVFQVEVFGIIKMSEKVPMVIFRELTYSSGFRVQDVQLLPFKEFYTKYKKYKLVEGE